MRAKRENWNGKYRVVIRDKGKIKAWQAWNNRNSVKKALSNYKKYRTLRPGVRKFKKVEERFTQSKRIDLKSFKKKTSFPQPRGIKERKQLIITITVNKKTFRGFSDAVDEIGAYERDEALSRAYSDAAVFYSKGETTNPEVGKEIISKSRQKVAVRYYVRGFI